MRLKHSSAQSILEYSVLLGVIIVAVLVLQVYIKRGYQGSIKSNVDQVGSQYSPRHTTSVLTSFSNTTSESYTGGHTEAGGMLGFNSTTGQPESHDIGEGQSVSVSNTTTGTSKRETVDAFKLEEF